MSDDAPNEPDAIDEARATLGRIETLLQTAVKELKQIRAIVAKRPDRANEVSHSDSTAHKPAAAIGAAHKRQD